MLNSMFDFKRFFYQISIDLSYECNHYMRKKMLNTKDLLSKNEKIFFSNKDQKSINIYTFY